MDLPIELPEFLRPLAQDARLQALLLFVLFLGAARIADWFFVNALKRLTSRTSSSLDDTTVAVLHKPIFYSFVLIGTSLALQRLYQPDPIANWMGATLKTLAIVIWSVTGSRLLVSLLGAIGGRRQSGVIQSQTLPLFVNLGKLLIVGGATYLVLVAWQINVTAWLASAGVLGIAIGFAAKDSLANFFAGVFIITDAPYRVGDFIVLDTGERGRVTNIGLRSSRMLTRDDIEVTLPNSIIGNAKIVNESRPYEHHRVRVQVNVAYGSDIDQVLEVLMSVAQSVPMVRSDPEPRVRFRTFGDSGLNIELLCWIDIPEDRGRAIHTLNIEIYKRFAQEGIEIPYPKRDVYVRQLPASAMRV